MKSLCLYRWNEKLNHERPELIDLLFLTVSFSSRGFDTIATISVRIASVRSGYARVWKQTGSGKAKRPRQPFLLGLVACEAARRLASKNRAMPARMHRIFRSLME